MAFYKTEADRKKIPPGFVPYSDQELRQLFRVGKTVPKSLHLVDEAKKYGGRITSSEPKRGEEEV